MPETPDERERFARRWAINLSADRPLLTVSLYRTPADTYWTGYGDEIEAEFAGRGATLLARYRDGKPLD